jgi:hypothetical protein
MSNAGKPENTVNIIIEAGEFTFNDSLEAVDGKAAREAGRAIANFALSLFATPRKRRRSSEEAGAEQK